MRSVEGFGCNEIKLRISQIKPFLFCFILLSLMLFLGLSWNGINWVLGLGFYLLKKEKEFFFFLQPIRRFLGAYAASELIELS